MRSARGQIIWGIVGAVLTSAAAAAAGALVLARMARATAAPVPPHPPTGIPSLFQYASAKSKADIDIGGNWTMLDVSTYSQASVAARASPTRGTIVALILDAGAGPFVFMAQVLGPSGNVRLPISGAWAIRAPGGGPQFIDFGPDHIYAVFG